MTIKLVYTKGRGWHENDHYCPNCGKLLDKGDGHFAPPSLGEECFYICTPVVFYKSPLEY